MKAKNFFSAVSIVLAMALTFSCSSDDDGGGGGSGTINPSSSSETISSSSSDEVSSSSSSSETISSSSSDEASSSSSSSETISSSSSDEVSSSSSSSETISSSSSDKVSSSSSSSETISSSSSDEVSSSSSAPPSSSSIESLACGTMPASGYASRPITPPALTCSGGETATGISWLGSPDWDSPKEGTYSNISVMANCGTVSSLTASCSGTITVQPMISCSMIDIGSEGTAITLPVLTCKDGSVPSNIVFSGSLPNWDNPASGNYEVFAEANCGFGTLPAISCGTLMINEVTLTCNDVPTFGYENIGISPPSLTCSHGILGAPTWENAPNWSNPVPGTYSDISVIATCGLATKRANCSGTLNVNGSVTHDDQTYKTVVIGTQTWMAENLNYNVSGSKCYDNSESNCTIYGRLYNWSTAMALPSSCNSRSCSDQIQSKHRGICPSGWHIPSQAEWNTLVTYAGGSNTAGTKLKARNGWNFYSGTENLDIYGFSALPGGGGGSNGIFEAVGVRGFWWGTSELNCNLNGCSNAYAQTMLYISGNAGWNDNIKSSLISVRCLQD